MRIIIHLHLHDITTRRQFADRDADGIDARFDGLIVFIDTVYHRGIAALK